MDPEQIANVLGTLLARGFEAPLMWCAIASNGSIMAGRYVSTTTNGLKAELLASHIEGDGLSVPINFMFTDSRGEAARIVFDTNGVAVLN
jgi:hypothetical protein